LFVLEFLVLLIEVFIERLRENVVNFLCQFDLSHLQLDEVVRNHGILEISMHKLFQKLHIFTCKLTQTFIKFSTNLWVPLNFSTAYVGDIALTIFKIFNEFFEILKHELPVG